MRFDAIVIGAGLAGLSAALAASEGGAQLALLEQRGAGSNATTPLTFADTISAFGLDEAVLARYHRFAFASPYGARCEHTYSQPALVALDYARAAALLLERARARGVDIITGRAASLARGNGDGWRLTLASGASLAAGVLVDASGRAFFSARQLGLPLPRSASHSFGGRMFNFQAVSGEDTPCFIAPSPYYGDGGGWYYPLGDGSASFGVATLRPGGSMFAGSALRAFFKRARHEMPPFNDWLPSSSVSRYEWGIIPIYPVKRFAYERLMLVGDCAGQATSWSCMGSEMALISGRMAGEALAGALANSDLSARGLRHYERAWRARYGQIYRQAEQLAPLVYGLNDEQWAISLEKMQQLTPEQMVERFRSNAPLLKPWQLAFILAYDRAGRIRRRLFGARAASR